MHTKKMGDNHAFLKLKKVPILNKTSYIALYLLFL